MAFLKSQSAVVWWQLMNMTDRLPSMEPLSPAEFRDVLRKGMGRAMVHVREHGVGGLEADILDACVHALGYDPQCEGTRGEWLWHMLESGGLKQSARPRILQSLKEATSDTDFWTVAQLFVLALLFAKEGDGDCRQVIYNKFDQQVYNEAWLGGLQIIQLDGMDGMLRVAQVLGARVLREPSHWVDDYVLTVAAEQLGEAAVMAMLTNRAQTDKDVQAFLANVQQQKNQRGQGASPPPAGVKEVLAWVDRPSDRGLWLRHWGRHASDEQIDTVFRVLLAEDRPARVARLLRVFSLRSMPSLPAKALDLAESQDEEVSDAAIDALAGRQDMAIRQLALRMLNRKPPTLDAVRLLARNYHVGDHRLIASVLPVEGSPDDLHSMGHAVLKVVEEAKDPQLSSCLEWLYKEGPCSECRNSTVNNLIKLRAVRPETLRECLLDCSEDTRKVARQALGLSSDVDWTT